jgi:hypothetical protein
MNQSAFLPALPGARPWRGRALLVLLASLLAHAWLLKVGRDALGTPQVVPGGERIIEILLRRPPPAVPEAAPVPAARPPAPARKAKPRPRPRPAPPPQPAPEPSQVAPVPSDLIPAEAEALGAPPPMVAVPALPDAIEPVATDAAANPPESGKEQLLNNAPATARAEAALPSVDAAPAASGSITGDFVASGPDFVKAMGGAPDVTLLPAEARYSYETSDTRFPALTGRATLTWRRDDAGGYAARLLLTALGIPVLELNSRGRLDAYGVAPERYTEKPVGRSAWATNFDVARSLVTFSRTTRERPLAEGIQDRLSFQFQLIALGPGLLARLQPGSALVLAIGGRDDTTSYRLKVVGTERVSTPAGNFDAVKLDKEPTPRDDARIEVWLAPDAAWLPVKLRFTDRNGQVTENVIAEMQTPKK